MGIQEACECCQGKNSSRRQTIFCHGCLCPICSALSLVLHQGKLLPSNVYLSCLQCPQVPVLGHAGNRQKSWHLDLGISLMQARGEGCSQQMCLLRCIHKGDSSAESTGSLLKKPSSWVTSQTPRVPTLAFALQKVVGSLKVAVHQCHAMQVLGPARLKPIVCLTGPKDVQIASAMLEP